jgi:phage terminase large subunit
MESARRHFNEETRDAIGWYHEKKSTEDRNIELGPNQDWSSQALTP